MKKLSFKPRFILPLTFSLFFLYFFRNAFFFPPRGSFDAHSHYHYANILTSFWRFPTPEESVHFHNPPFWYFLGGLSIRLFEKISKITDWKQTTKIWQLVNPFLTSLTLICWLKIYQLIQPQKIKRWLFFSIFLFSIPLLQKMTAMLSVEPLLLTFSSLALFIFLQYLITPKPRLLKLLGLILAFAVLTKITIFSLVITLLLMLFYLKAIKFSKTSSLGRNLILVLLPIMLIGGWFYTWKQINYGLLRPGGVEYAPKKQPLSFYFDIPLKLMFTYPTRHYEVGQHLGRTFLPLMYTDFWGDYWNYYPQRRYGLEVEYIRSVDRYLITPERVKALVFQGLVNLPVTLFFIFSLVWATINTFKALKQKKTSPQHLFNLTLIIFFILSCLGYLWFQSRSPKWTGSNVKPYHLLFIWPIPVFFTTEAFFKLTQQKSIMRRLVGSFLFFTFISNLIFSWF